MILNKDSIFATLAQHGPALQRFGVRRLGLFGSTLRGDATDSSDLDFVVEFERKTFRAYMGLKLFLEDQFGRKVDLVMPDGIKPALRERILKEVVYAAGN